MPVPINSLKMVGAVALFITQAGTLDFVKIAPIKGRYFRCKYGVYQLDYSKRINFEGTTLFIYDTRIANPLSVEACRRIQLHLNAENKFVLIRDVVALNHREFTQELGKSTMRFLGDLQKTDMASILNLMNNALQSDKKLPSSEPISQSMVGFFSMFSISASNLAFIFVDNAVLKIVPLHLIRTEDRLIGKCRYGDLDLTYRRNRYTYQKTSIYITTIDTRPLDLNDFKVENIDYSKGENEEIIDTEQPELETVDSESVLVTASNDSAPEKKQPKQENEDVVIVAADYDGEDEPEPKKKIIMVKESEVKKSRIPFRIGSPHGNGNGKPRKEDIDLPSTIKPQDLGKPLTLNMYAMIHQFANYDPSLVEEAYLEGKYAKNAVNAVSPPPKKKQFNIWFLVGIVIIGVIAYQAVGNPLISKWQTDQQREAEAARFERQELARLEAERANNQNGTNSNPRPPVNGTGSEPVGGGGRIIPPATMIAPLVRTYGH